MPDVAPIFKARPWWRLLVSCRCLEPLLFPNAGSRCRLRAAETWPGSGLVPDIACRAGPYLVRHSTCCTAVHLVRLGTGGLGKRAADRHGEATAGAAIPGVLGIRTLQAARCPMARLGGLIGGDRLVRHSVADYLLGGDGRVDVLEVH